MAAKNDSVFSRGIPSPGRARFNFDYRSSLLVVTGVLSAAMLTACPTGSGADGGNPTPLAPLVINEVMAANSTTLADDAGEFDDWIEIKNEGDTAISLAGFSLSDDPLEPQKFTFGDTAPSVPAGGYVVVFADKDVDQGALHADFRLSRDGEGVYLSDSSERLVSEVGFGPQFDDISFGRANDEGTATFLATATPGAANSSARTTFPDGGPTPSPEPDAGEPDAPPTDAGPPPPAATSVVINEIVVVNATGLEDEAGEREPWIELLNTGAEEVSLRAHALKDDRALVNRWIFPDDTTLEAGGYLVLFADGDPVQGNRHADVSLLPSGGELSLIAPDLSTIDTVTYGPQAADGAFGRMPNGTGDFESLAPTPGAENAFLSVDAGVTDGGAIDDAGTTEDAGATEDAGTADGG